MSQNTENSRQLFATPFSKEYWRLAAGELKKTKVLIFAALMIALRVALKPLNIPVAADIRINIAPFVNAFGAMVFGPVVAIISAAISDTLGFLIYPNGFYFFPMIFVEIAGSLIFALFFYRAKMTVWRVILARFSVSFLVNIVLTTPLMWWYYSIFLPNSTYAIFDAVRFVKNIAMFPIESILLVLFFRALIPPTNKQGYVYTDAEKLTFTKANIIVLAILFVIGVGAVAGYAVNYYNTRSVSADYTPELRLQMNTEMNAWVLAENPQLDPETTVTVIESGYRKVGRPELTYTLSVYSLDMDAFNEKAAADDSYTLDKVKGYSKSPASKDDALMRIGGATAVTDKKTGEHISLETNLD